MQHVASWSELDVTGVSLAVAHLTSRTVIVVLHAFAISERCPEVIESMAVEAEPSARAQMSAPGANPLRVGE